MNSLQEDMLDFVRRRLREVGRAHWDELADKHDVGIRTIERIAYNAPNDTRYGAVKRLANALGYRVRVLRSKAAA